MDYRKVSACAEQAILAEILSCPKQVKKEDFARVIAAGIVAALTEQEAQVES